MLFHEHPVTRRQLLPRYPGGSADRRVCLEDTKKDSTASGASSWTAADGGPTTQLAPYSFVCLLFFFLSPCRAWAGVGLRWPELVPTHPLYGNLFFAWWISCWYILTSFWLSRVRSLTSQRPPYQGDHNGRELGHGTFCGFLSAVRLGLRLPSISRRSFFLGFAGWA